VADERDVMDKGRAGIPIGAQPGQQIETPYLTFRRLSPRGLRRCLWRWHGDEWRCTRLPHLSYRRVRSVVFHSMSSSRVDTPNTLTIDEPAFLTARVQARELGREPVERVCYVE